MNKKNSAFTLLEILMVIIIVGILIGTALPQFLKFRKESRIAATVTLVEKIREAVKSMQMKIVRRCGYTYENLPLQLYDAPGLEVIFDVVAQGYCTTAQFPDPAERRLLDSDLFPANPINGVRSVNNEGCDSRSQPISSNGACIQNSTPAVGWCFDANKGTFYASVADIKECE